MMAAVASPVVSWWALVPLVTFAAAGFLLLTMASLVRRPPAVLAPAWTVAAGVAVLGYTVPMWSRVGSDGASSFLAGAVGVDASSVFVTGILAVAVIAAALIAHDYLPREDLPGVEFYVLLLLSAAGGVVMASANDLIVLFLGLEVLSIAVYVLAAMHLRRIESQEAALKYFLLGAFSSAFLLYGIALVYGATGSTNMATISAYLARTVLIDDAMLLAGLALLLVGLGFKVAVVPFHAWTPDVYQGAPTPVVAWMAAGVKAAGFAALLRVFVLTFGSWSGEWQPAVWGLAILTVLGGSIVAVVQTDVKRMLAYSSIAHAGFLLVGVQAASDRGTAAVLAYRRGVHASGLRQLRRGHRRGRHRRQPPRPRCLPGARRTSAVVGRCIRRAAAGTGRRAVHGRLRGQVRRDRRRCGRSLLCPRRGRHGGRRRRRSVPTMGRMIAWAGVERLALGLSDPLDVAARARWPLDAAAAGRIVSPRRGRSS